MTITWLFTTIYKQLPQVNTSPSRTWKQVIYAFLYKMIPGRASCVLAFTSASKSLAGLLNPFVPQPVLILEFLLKKQWCPTVCSKGSRVWPGKPMRLWGKSHLCSVKCHAHLATCRSSRNAIFCPQGCWWVLGRSCQDHLAHASVPQVLHVRLVSSLSSTRSCSFCKYFCL